VSTGAHVIRAYHGNTLANATCFYSSFLRTGDKGYMDCDGWVFLTGRFKEIINRGGEKISPSSIEEAVLGFADVHSCLVFGFPDAELGEDIGLMVVLKSEAMAFSLASIRKYLASSGVASFKLPSLLIFAKYLPVGPTRKPLRIGLHAKLGLDFSHKVILVDVRHLTLQTILLRFKRAYATSLPPLARDRL